ncbi:DUF5926 family protein [Aeromicrobium sp. Leaf350]|uniref:DUF5926 family protein n=1 Tax=Aeromicrobium sp. Leaf350 TaxID=2876565 RepID=UPI001E2E0185|nr:DUF5926 family protein [Aeromicrobium sp. Leaf350]
MGKKSRRKGEKKARMPYVARTFEGLAGELDLVALREFVPSATGTVTLAEGVEGAGREIQVCSLLPGNGAGLVRPDGQIWVGLQVLHNHGDISRDYAGIIETALTLEPGQPVAVSDPGVGPRLQELLVTDAPFEVTVHEGFDFWLEGVEAGDQARALLEQANASAAPTVKLDGVEAAYWTQMGERRFLRWVQPHDESTLLDAFARLHAAGEDHLGEGVRLIGMFRAHGLLVPVWETDGEAAALEEPAVALKARIDEALADTSDLTAEQRDARSGLANRQLTIR